MKNYFLVGLNKREIDDHDPGGKFERNGKH